MASIKSLMEITFETGASLDTITPPARPSDYTCTDVDDIQQVSLWYHAHNTGSVCQLSTCGKSSGNTPFWKTNRIISYGQHSRSLEAIWLPDSLLFTSPLGDTVHTMIKLQSGSELKWQKLTRPMYKINITNMTWNETSCLCILWTHANFSANSRKKKLAWSDQHPEHIPSWSKDHLVRYFTWLIQLN